MPERTPEGAKRQRSTPSEAESCADGLSWHNHPAEGKLIECLGRNGTKWNESRVLILRAGRTCIPSSIDVTDDDLAEEEHLTRIRMTDNMQMGEYPTLRT